MVMLLSTNASYNACFNTSHVVVHYRMLSVCLSNLIALKCVMCPVPSMSKSTYGANFQQLTMYPIDLDSIHIRTFI